MNDRERLNGATRIDAANLDGEETRYSGEDVLAMLVQYDIDPGDLPDILQEEQARRRNDFFNELYRLLVCETSDSRYDLISEIADMDVLRELLLRFAVDEAANKRLRRDQARLLDAEEPEYDKEVWLAMREALNIPSEGEESLPA